MMEKLLLICQFLPLVGLLLIVVVGNSERLIANISLWTTYAMGLTLIGLLYTWGQSGFVDYEFRWLTLFKTQGYEFPLIYFFDATGAVYLFCIWVISSVIIRYCRYYMHREAGIKRFFVTIFAFIFGLHIVVLSGLLDMLFAGWEIVGLSSFLLIAFYRHRSQPIRNAIRAYMVYRFCDLGLLLAAWLCDLLLPGNNHFSELQQHFASSPSTPGDAWAHLALSLFVLIAATGKSAQFPFSYWLPRAMEGPTPSSAIFYGALSVHLGVFLLLRTYPIWAYEWFTQAIVFCIGFITVVLSSLSERSQSNIKGQIAYASITQVGFMFMELALGFKSWVLLHFLGNAFLRCYQLLVSPSVVAHMLRLEGALDTGLSHSSGGRSPKAKGIGERIRISLQVMALQEFNLETLVRAILWSPIRKAGDLVNSLKFWTLITAGTLVILTVSLGVWFGFVDSYSLAIPVATIMVLASSSAFSQRRDAFKVWNRVGMSCLFAALATGLTNKSSFEGIVLYVSGVVPAWIVGWFILRQLLSSENYKETPFMYRGMAEKKPMASMVFLFGCLGLISFPITPAFLGQDLLLFSVSEHHPAIIILLALSFVVNGIATANIYMRLCMGRPVAVPQAT